LTIAIERLAYLLARAVEGQLDGEARVDDEHR
jgi:hypothetical protein